MKFEEFNVGDRFTTATIVFNEADIIDFATLYDPQPFHVDPESGTRSIYGGLIASGWHVLCRMFREVVELRLFEEAGQGAPGLENVRWLQPVRPGDALTLDLFVDEKRISDTHPSRGYLTMRFEIRNQTGEVVASYSAREIFRRSE